MDVKIVNQSPFPAPTYATAGAAGMDLCANIEGSVTLAPAERKLIPTGLFIELPLGYEAQVRPRSGLALKHGVTVLNSPGTIDADYRGEVKVLLVNLGDTAFTIEPGDRIAQMIVARHETVNWVQVDELSSSDRGAGGYGSSGVKLTEINTNKQ